MISFILKGHLGNSLKLFKLGAIVFSDSGSNEKSWGVLLTYGRMIIIANNNNNGIRHAAALRQLQHTGHVHGFKVSPDFLDDAGENIDRSELQQSAPRVGRVCDFFFFLYKSIFCCNPCTNISAESGSATQ